MSDAAPAKLICKVCDKELLPSGKFCNECKSLQNWRRHFSGLQVHLALLTAIISVITSAITAGSWACYHHSHTSATVISDATAGISVYVWNVGRNPSVVLTCTLRYSGASDEDIELELDRQTTLIPAEGHSIVPLIKIPKPKNPAAVRAATLILRVQESNGHPKDLQPLPLSKNFVTQVHNMS